MKGKNFHRLLSVFLAVVLLVSLFPAAALAVETETTSSEAALPTSPYLNLEDHFAYVVGYPDGTVRPEGNITRAEVATIFFRMLTDEAREEYWSQTNSYNDVTSSDWYHIAVSTLSNLGILGGYPDGGFHPNANITRAEFATIAVRFFEETDKLQTEDAFNDTTGHWAKESINLAYALGIVGGYPDGGFHPNANITRAEAMTIVNNTLRRSPSVEGIAPVGEDMTTWSDNMDPNKWYYAAVQEATNSHEYTYMEDLNGEQWTAILPARDWSALEKEWASANAGETADEPETNQGNQGSSTPTVTPTPRPDDSTDDTVVTDPATGATVDFGEASVQSMDVEPTSVAALAGTPYVAYDITPYTADGDKYTGSAQVTIPLSKELKALPESRLTGFVVEANGSVTYIPGARAGDNYTFTTPHFSVVGASETDGTIPVTLYVGETVTLTQDDTGSISGTEPNASIATAKVVNLSTTAKAQLGSDANYTGDMVFLSNALFTFTGSGTSYTISATVPGTTTTVYLNPANSSSGQFPCNTTSGVVTIGTGGTTGTFSLQGAAGSSGTGRYLYFWRNGYNYFDRNGSTSSPATDFLLYRPKADGETSSTEISGYVQVTSTDQITSGSQYLIAALYSDAYYVLYPSNSSTKYDHVGKVDIASNTASTQITIKGMAAGNTSVTVGGTTYNIQVQARQTASTPESGSTSGQPFSSGTGGSTNFRIPALITLSNGNLLAAADARYSGTGDGYGLDTIVSYSTDSGSTWNYSFVNYFDDSTGYNGSASAFIDPVLVQGKDGIVYLFADLYPGGGYYIANIKSGTGFTTVDGVSYLALYSSADATSSTTPAYYVANELNSDGYYTVYDYSSKTASNYALDAEYDIYTVSDGTYTAVTGTQIDSTTTINANVFYTGTANQSGLYVLGTEYITMRKGTVNADGSITWGGLRLLNVKNSSEYFYGFGPGGGVVTSNGRIIVPLYTYANSADGNTSVIYSDDNGATWTRSADVNVQTSEASISEVTVGETNYLYMFTRHGGYFVSEDNGATWSTQKSVNGISYTTSCELSTLTYSEQIDGCPAILLSAPTSNRTTGKIFVGLVQTEGSINWKYTYAVNGSGTYQYSDLAELPDGSIGLLYEDGAASITYTNISISTIASGAQIGEPKPVEVTVPVDYTVTLLNSTGTYTSYTGGDSTVATVDLNSFDLEGVSSTSAITSITSGKSYLIQCDHSASKQLLTDEAIGEMLTISGDVSADSTELWTITGNDTDGYTVVQNGKYLSIGNNKATMSTDPVVLKLNYDTTYNVWTIAEANGTYYLNRNGGSGNAAGWTGGVTDTANRWNLYEIVPAEGTEITITGEAEGTTSIQVGYTVYNITVRQIAEEIDVTLTLGQSKDYTVTGGDYTNSITVNDADIASVSGEAGPIASAAIPSDGSTYLIFNTRSGKLLTDSKNAEDGTGLLLDGSVDASSGELWTIKSVADVENGYTIQNAEGKYLYIGQDSATWSDDPVTLALQYRQWPNMDPSWTIAKIVGSKTYFLNHFGGGNSVKAAGDSGQPDDTGSQWLLYEVKDGNFVNFETEVTITGQTIGETTAIVGTTKFNITVVPKKQGVTLYLDDTSKTYSATGTIETSQLSNATTEAAAIGVSITYNEENGTLIFTRTGTAEAGPKEVQIGDTVYHINVKEKPVFVTSENTPFTVGTGVGDGQAATKLTTSVGLSFDLDLNVTGSTVIWSIDDDTIATVDQNGNITGIAPGETAVTVTIDGVSYSIPVIIRQDAATDDVKTYSFYIAEIRNTTAYYVWNCEDTLVEAQAGEVLYISFDKTANTACDFFGKPDSGYALTFMSSTNSSGNYYALNGDTAANTDFYQNGAPIASHTSSFGAESVQAMIQAAIDLGCDGAMGWNRTSAQTGDTSSGLVFVSQPLPSVEKEIESVTYDGGTRKSMYGVWGIKLGDTITYSITVTIPAFIDNNGDRVADYGYITYTEMTLKDIMMGNLDLEKALDGTIQYTGETKTLTRTIQNADGTTSTESTILTQGQSITNGGTLISAVDQSSSNIVLTFSASVKVTPDNYSTLLSSANDTSIPSGTIKNTADLGYTYSSSYSAGTESAVSEAEIIAYMWYDSYTLDFGLPVTIDLANEPFLKDAGYTLVNVTSPGVTNQTARIDCVKDDGKESFTYTLLKPMLKYDLVTYMVQHTDGNEYSYSIYIAPASNMLYEESFFTPADPTTYNTQEWTNDGSATVTEQTLPNFATDYYGFDSSYQGKTRSSAGTIYRTSGLTPSNGSVVLSTEFYGYAFDLIGECGSDTAMIMLVIKDYETGKVVSSAMIDTRYVDTSVTTGYLSQVPLAHLTFDEGHYIALVSAYYIGANSHYSVSGTRSAIDGFRVYRSATNQGFSTWEYQATYVNVLDAYNGNLIAYVEGSDSTDGGYSDRGDYEKSGPQNEIYLRNGQGVSFQVTGLNDTTVSFIQVSARAVTGTAVALSAGTDTIPITSNTEMYYKVTPNGDGTVTLTNAGDGILALGFLKLPNGATITSN